MTDDTPDALDSLGAIREAGRRLMAWAQIIERVADGEGRLGSDALDLIATDLAAIGAGLGPHVDVLSDLVRERAP